MFLAHLHSKEDDIREISLKGFKFFAKQCSDVEAVKKLVTHMFAVLNGKSTNVKCVQIV